MLASFSGGVATLWRVDSKSWIEDACSRTTRNLSYDEWRQYREGPYEKTCANKPANLKDSWLVRARQGNVQEALAILQRAKELEPDSHLDPKQEVAREVAAQDSVLFGRQSVKTKPLEAFQAYQKAEGVDAYLLYANDWNNVCWYGSLQGFAKEVMLACEKAVNMAPTNPDYLDSRGLARALTGDTQNAISDFTTFQKSGHPEELKKLRRDWIQALQAGQNPFTPELLKSLASQ